MHKIIDTIFSTAAQNAYAPAICSANPVLTYADIAATIQDIWEILDRAQPPRLARTFINIQDTELRGIAAIAALHWGLVPLLIPTPRMFPVRPRIDFVIGADALLDDAQSPRVRVARKLAGVRPVNTETNERHPRGESDPYLVGVTSGTTGVPKLIGYTRGSMDRRGALAEELRFAPGERVMSTIGQNNSYGFVHAYRVLEQGACIVRMEQNVLVTLKVINAYGVTSLHTTPPRALGYADAMQRHGIRCPTVSGLTLTGSLFSASQLQRIESAFPGARVRVVYGSSETGGMAMGDVSSSSFEAGYVGTIRPGVKLVQQDAARGEPAELVFINDANLLGSEVSQDGSISTPGETYTLPDTGSIRDGRIYLAGRKDEVANVGGTKLSFHLIEDELRRFPEILDVGIANAPTPSNPARLAVALVFGSQDAAPDLDDLRDTVFRKFSAAKAAATCVTMLRTDSIPRNEMGKLDRKALLALAGE